jgi:hypothetical protein
MSRIRVIHTREGTVCVSKGKICSNNGIQKECMKCFVYTGYTGIGNKKTCFKAGEKFDDSGGYKGKKTHKRT